MKLVGALTYRKLLSYPESAELAKHMEGACLLYETSVFHGFKSYFIIS